MADPIQTQPLMSQGRAVRTSPALPVHARRGAFMPEIGGFINVKLPGEVVRGTVEEIFSDDIVTVKLTGTVMGKTGHTFKTNDIVALRRVDGAVSESWEPISDREVREQEERERAASAARKDAHAGAAVVQAPQPPLPPPPVVAQPAPDLADSAAFPPRPSAAVVQEIAAASAPMPHRVLGPRRSRVAAPVQSAPSAGESATGSAPESGAVRHRVLGPRRSKIARGS